MLFVNKYWFLSVAFLYKSTISFPFLILTEVSKNGIDSSVWQEHLSLSVSPLEVVCFFIVSLMFG